MPHIAQYGGALNSSDSTLSSGDSSSEDDTPPQTARTGTSFAEKRKQRQKQREEAAIAKAAATRAAQSKQAAVAVERAAQQQTAADTLAKKQQAEQKESDLAKKRKEEDADAKRRQAEQKERDLAKKRKEDAAVANAAAAQQKMEADARATRRQEEQKARAGAEQAENDTATTAAPAEPDPVQDMMSAFVAALWIAMADAVQALLGVNLGEYADKPFDFGSKSNDDTNNDNNSSYSNDNSSGTAPLAPLDPFVELGLPPKGEGVDAAQVKKAYRKLALRYHPDKCAQSGIRKDEASSKMKQINAARDACVAKLEGKNPGSQWDVDVDTDADDDDDDDTDDDYGSEAGYGPYIATWESGAYYVWKRIKQLSSKRKKGKKKAGQSNKFSDMEKDLFSDKQNKHFAKAWEKEKEYDREQRKRINEIKKKLREREEEMKQQAAAMRSEQTRAEQLRKQVAREACLHGKKREAAAARAAAKIAAAKRAAEDAGKEYFPKPPRIMMMSTHPLALAVKGKLDSKIHALLLFGDTLHGSAVAPDEILDSEGNTVLHYAAAFNSETMHALAMSRLGLQWDRAVLATNHHGQTPLDLVGGVEMRDRLNELHPAALTKLTQYVADSCANGLVPNPRHAFWKLAAGVLFVAIVAWFKILEYRDGLASIFFITGVRFTNSELVGLGLCIILAPVATALYNVVYGWGCMNGHCYQASWIVRAVLPALAVPWTPLLNPSRAEESYAEQVAARVGVPIAMLRKYGLMPASQGVYRTTVHMTLDAVRVQWEAWFVVPVLCSSDLLLFASIAPFIGPIAIILCIIFCIDGKANSGGQLVAKLKEVMQGSRTGYKHVLRWWLLVAIMYIGATLTTDVLTYCARWFHCTWCQNLGDRCSGLVDIFPPTFWSPGANATCWLPEDAGASGVEDGYLWHTWAEPGYKPTALYHVCNTIFWQRD